MLKPHSRREIPKRSLEVPEEDADFGWHVESQRQYLQVVRAAFGTSILRLAETACA